MARMLGFGKNDQTRIATAISEITRNILQHSGTEGEVHIDTLHEGNRHGITVTITDTGVGIQNLDTLLDTSYASVNRLGAGLPGTQSLMDEFTIDTAPGQGTTVKFSHWLKNN